MPKLRWTAERERLRGEVERLERELRQAKASFANLQTAIDGAGVRDQVVEFVRLQVEALLKETTRPKAATQLESSSQKDGDG